MRSFSEQVGKATRLNNGVAASAEPVEPNNVDKGELVSAVLDVVGALVIVLDTEGRIVGFNRACERTTGYSAEEVRGECFWDFLVLPEEREAVRAVFSELRTGAFPNEHKNAWLTKDGNLRLIAWSNTALFNNDEVAYVIGTGIDITEQREAQEALKQSEEEWRAITEYSPDHIMLLDRDANILFINRTIEELSKEDVIGTSFYDYPLEEQRGAAQASFEHVLRSGEPDRFEHTYVDGNGRRRVFETYVGPVMRHGQVQGLTARSTDITERKEAEQALEDISHELGERLKELKCLYAISTLVDRSDVVLPEALQEAADLLPPGWQHPEIACARVTLDGEEYATENFRQTGWQQTRDIWVHGRRAGQVQVCYLEETPEQDRGPFRNEERHLISAVAERLGRTVERARAQQEIARLARFPGENPYPVLRIDADGSVLYANRASAPLLDAWGCEVGQPLPDDWRQFVRDALRAGERQDADVEIAERTLALSFAPVVQQGYVNLYGLDITALKQAQERLKRSEERYALAESAASIGSWDWDIETGDLHWSEQIEPMFGFDRGDFQGTYDAFLQSVHPEDRQGLIDAVNASVEEGADYNFEHRVLLPDGTLRWMVESGDVIRDERGKAVRMLGVVRDITQRKQAEIQIEDQNTFLSSILESVTHPLYVVDTADYSVRMANSAAYSGPLPEDATCYRLFHGRRVPCAEAGYECPIEEIKRTRGEVTAEHVHHDASGTERTMEIRGYPLFDDDGDVEAVIEYCLDVTERKHMEKALREAKEAAEEARREEERRRLEADRRRQIAESLADVLAALNSNRPLDEVLDYIVEQASQLSGAQAVAICRLDDDGEALVVEAAHCAPCEGAASTDFPAGIETLVEALNAQQTVAVPNLSARTTEATRRERAPGAHESNGEPFQALIAVPLVVEAETYGGLLLNYARPQSFSDQEVELAAVFSDQIALAVENARLREQIEKAAADAERNRLARELHDSVTQALFSASLVAETLPRVWERDPEEAKEGLEELRDLTRGALAEMRTLLLELRPTALAQTPLDTLLRQLTEAAASRAQLPVTVDIAPSPTLPPEVLVNFYRVAQEALHNALKHADATELAVSLQVSPPISSGQADRWHGCVILIVTDDGRGFETDQAAPDHLGLGIMRERAEAIGADLSVRSQIDQGTEVSLLWKGRHP